MPTDFEWRSPEVTPSDQRLIDAYVAVGQPLDELPYSEGFEELVRRLGGTDALSSRHALWKRLLYLRKRALLPRTSLPNEGHDRAARAG